MLFDSNLGFLPVSTTVLIRGEKNILVDPGNTHTGFYGQLAIGLNRFGLTPGDIDLVVCTHCHHDHMASAVCIPGVDMVLGEGEADFCEELYGAADTEARLSVMGRLIEVGRGEEMELMPGVVAVSTPGHTPGHISVMAENEEGERVIMAGDTVMTRREYSERTFSHWYTSGQLRELHSSLDRLQAPPPGHRDAGPRPGLRSPGELRWGPCEPRWWAPGRSVRSTLASTPSIPTPSLSGSWTSTLRRRRRWPDRWESPGSPRCPTCYRPASSTPPPWPFPSTIATRAPCPWRRPASTCCSRNRWRPPWRRRTA